MGHHHSCPSYENEINGIIKNLEECNITKNYLYEKNNDLETKLYSCNNNSNDLETKLYSCNNNSNDLETKLYSCNNNANDLETKLYSCNNNVNDLETQLDSCNNNVNDLETQLHSCNNNFNDLHLILNKYINKNNNLELRLKKLENENIQNKNIIESQNSEIKKLKKEISTNQKKEFSIDIGLGLFSIIIVFALIFILFKYFRQRKRIQDNKNEKIISKEEQVEFISDED